jgi:diadenylate cyclase
MKEFWSLITSMQITDVIDILLVAGLFYLLFSLLKETRSAVALRGLIGVLLLSFLIFFIAKYAHLNAVATIFERFWVIGVLVFIIVFQNEFRKALTEVGQIKIFRHFFVSSSGRYCDEMVKAVGTMSSRKIGALIAIERRNSLKTYADTGTAIDSEISGEILRTIFSPYTPLHDGAVIVRNERIVAAGCILPLSDSAELSKELGTRHRAAVGLSEETDAVVIVVSEETGTISLAVHGKLTRGETAETLKQKLVGLLDIESEAEHAA